jgi:short-subunit dehydrogenase
MPTRELRGQRALITGASGGIGEALARELAARGVRLVLFARRADRLERLAAELSATVGTVEYFSGDVTKADDRARALEVCRTRLGGLDLLVNNAGVGALGRFDEAAPDRLRTVFEVNFFAAVELTQVALPLLKAGRQPLVVNIGSILGWQGIPNYTEYCASKFALRGFSEALRGELARDGVGVLHVAPGRTQTEFFENVVERNAPLPLAKSRGMRADAVARLIVQAMERGQPELITGPGGRWLVRAGRWFPRITNWFVARLAGGEENESAR